MACTCGVCKARRQDNMLSMLLARCRPVLHATEQLCGHHSGDSWQADLPAGRCAYKLSPLR